MTQIVQFVGKHDADVRGFVLLAFLAVSAMFAGGGWVKQSASRADNPSPAGNAERGRALLKQHSCLTCHGKPGEGGGVGPDLSGIGSRRSRKHMTESILDPNKELTPGYGRVTLLTSSGEELSGAFVGQDGGGITLKLARGEAKQVPWDKIHNHKFHSPMPDNYGRTLSAKDLDDLLACLEGL